MSTTGNSIYTIHEMNQDDRPRERLAQYGPERLSNEELLAILLRVGVEGENALQMASRILRENNSLVGLYRTGYPELCNQHGIGPAKAAQLLAAMELGKRIALAARENQGKVTGPADVYNALQYDMLALDQEELWVLLLDTRNNIIQKDQVYRGSVNSSQVRISEIFKGAIRRNATSIIIAHNHPSGDPSPSPEDIALTKAVIQAGRLLDIEVLDHIVVGHQKYASLKEKGLAFD